MRRIVPLTLSFAFALPVPAEDAPHPAAAKDGPATFRLIKDRCSVTFFGSSTLHDFSGGTKAVAGEITCDLADLEPVTAAIEIDARTLDTGNEDRDKEMHEDHLRSEKHPKILFTLRKVNGLKWEVPGKKGAFTMAGELEIHGTKRAVEIPAKGELKDGVLTVAGEVEVKMKDFGITPPSTFLIINVSNRVKVRFQIEAGPAPGDAKAPDDGGSK